jgi:hypothetical protein
MRRTGHPACTFSTAYGLTCTAADDWFDSTLHTDTALFVDPFLMFNEHQAPWSTVERQLVQFFNEALLRVAASRGGSALERTTASAMLSFPEPAALCLGYGDKTIFGSGSGSGLGQAMRQAANDAITAGITNISQFGELLLFGEGMGCDRVSDVVCNIIKSDLITYTQAVAVRNGIPMTTYLLPHVGYDYKQQRWHRQHVELPANPCWEKTPVILVPRRFLDELPGLDDDAFWEWVYDSHNEQLRHDLNVAIGQQLKRREIIALAKRRSTLRLRYGQMYVAARRKQPLRPYDLERDPKNLVLPKQVAAQFSSLTQVEPPTSPEGFTNYIFSLAEDFKRLVENSGIWRNFWDGSRPRDEANAQGVFRAAVTLACRDRDIDVSPEANAGAGPVDFKFSQGWKRRSIVELKLASSSSFWNNIEEQPPTYMDAEDLTCGVIVVFQLEDKHCSEAFTAQASEAVESAAKERKIDYRIVFVDVRPKTSASKRKRAP